MKAMNKQSKEQRDSISLKYLLMKNKNNSTMKIKEKCEKNYLIYRPK